MKAAFGCCDMTAGAPFKKFASLRDAWAMEDDYRSPGILILPFTINRAMLFGPEASPFSRVSWNKLVC